MNIVFWTVASIAACADASRVVKDLPVEVSHETSNSEDPFSSCPQQLAAVSSCFVDESSLDVCFDCTLSQLITGDSGKASVSFCDEVAAFAGGGAIYETCVEQDQACNPSCANEMTSLAECLRSALECDGDGGSNSSVQSKGLRAENNWSGAGKDLPTCISGGIAFHCNWCCASNTCGRLGKSWPARLFKRCSAPPASSDSSEAIPAVAPPPDTSSPSISPAPSQCVLAGPAPSCASCCYQDCSVKTEIMCHFEENYETMTLEETCTTKVETTCFEPTGGCVPEGSASSCDRCCKNCVKGATNGRVECNLECPECKNNIDCPGTKMIWCGSDGIYQACCPKFCSGSRENKGCRMPGMRPRPGSSLVAAPVFTAEE